MSITTFAKRTASLSGQDQPTERMRLRLRRLARQYGILGFRPGQEETMVQVLSGVDTLAIMPTGAGKSLCYQLPSQVLKGTTLVVSPLISLMKDQHEKLEQMGLGYSSQHLSSELTRKQARDAIHRLGHGEMSIQFVTPEKLENPAVIEAFRRTHVGLFVVDEAHCISEWGHDFRPAYLGLIKVIEILGHPTVLALTATATPEVMRDIQSRLGFREGSKVVRISYRRDNLILRARTFDTETEKHSSLFRVLKQFRGHRGIVYCASVRQTETLWASLRAQGFTVVKYHGRLKKAERTGAQRRFMHRPGIVMLATSAFGMGIDKSDVRFVINYQIPSSIEAYYQEIGRAGRDNRKSFGLVFYTSRDRALQRVLQLRKYPNAEMFRRVIDVVFAGVVAEAGAERNESHPKADRHTPIAHVMVGSRIGKKRLAMILKLLEARNLVGLDEKVIYRIRRPAEFEIQAMLRDWERRKVEDRQRLDEMVRYVHSNLCRWYYLLRYFGESLQEPCGTCDNCRKQVALQSANSGSGSAIVPGEYVRHAEWGVGEVVSRVGPNLKVFFPGVGEKILRPGFVRPWIQNAA